MLLWPTPDPNPWLALHTESVFIWMFSLGATKCWHCSQAGLPVSCVRQALRYVRLSNFQVPTLQLRRVSFS